MACDPKKALVYRAALEARAIAIYEWAIVQGEYFFTKDAPGKVNISVEGAAVAMLVDRGLIARSGNYRPVRYRILRIVAPKDCLEIKEGISADHLNMKRVAGIPKGVVE